MIRDDPRDREQLLLELKTLRWQLERAEADAQTRELRAQLLLDQMYEFVALLTPEGEVLEANLAALELVGACLSSVLDRPLWEGDWWKGLPNSQATLRQAIADAAAGQFVRYEAQHWGNPERTELTTVDFSLKPIFGTGGNLRYLVAEGRDISRLKRAQAALARTNDELHDLSVRFEHDEGIAPLSAMEEGTPPLADKADERPRTARENLEHLAADLAQRGRELEAALDHTRVAREQAEKALEVREKFLGLVSHELRTPLTALRLQIQKLQRHGSSGPLATALQKMAAAEKRLTEMVVALIAQARLDSGQLQQDKTRLDVAALLEELCDELRPRAERKGLGLKLSCEPDLPPLVGDPRLLRLIVSNLLDNAIKFTEQGEVQICVRFSNGAHRFYVDDTGPGIAPEHRALIFQPFWHADPLTCKHTPGIGLGLALVRQVVQSLGGHIELNQGCRCGTSIEVVLPSRPAGQGAIDRPAAPGIAAEGTSESA